MGGTAITLGILGVALEWSSLRGLLKLRPLPLSAGLLVGVGMTLATYPLYRLLPMLAPQMARDTVRLYARLGPSSLLSLALVPAVVGEEVVWRGVIQGSLVRRFGNATAVPLGAVVYALAQIPVRSPVLVFAALVCGLAWGSLRAMANSLIATIVAHLLWSEVLFLFVPLART
ncbi:MAG TPA: CPBP family intramembrane glutamic endopeptidase [Polyangia bacterium]|nr:CPBP family intramembrane glutamic endopeptidase [Polyangia bacterium]